MKYFPSEVSHEKMVSIQSEIAEKAVFEDDFGQAGSVAGVDQAFDGGDVISASVLLSEGEKVDEQTTRQPASLPYIPGLLAFREGPAVARTLQSHRNIPDVVLVDGNGRTHPRQAGLATHVGVALEIPTIGVAKSLLCGEPRHRLNRLEEGEQVAVEANDEVEAPTGTVIGYALQTKQYAPDAETSVNPIYVSPGHRVDAETATETVTDYCDGYKLPEPVRLADELAEQVKSKRAPQK